MKKHFSATILFCSLFASSYAQQATGQAQSTPEFQPSYAVKFNPASLWLGKIGILGEYNLKPKKSITLAVGIPTSKTTNITIDDEKRAVTMKTFSAMAGYRMYLGKKTMTGVYFEPYLKYVKNDAFTVINTDLDGTPTDLQTTSKYSGFGAGGQLGVQFMIAKRVVFDFFFLGPEANLAKHNLVVHDNSAGTWDEAEAADAEREINESIGDLPIIGKKIDVKVDAATKTITSDYSGFLPGFRFGLSVGFRF